MKNKTTGPNMKQWKEFRYNLVKENIEIDADREEDLQNWMNEPDEPHTYQLKNGKTLEIEEKDAPGMAGEPSTFILLSVDRKRVRFEQIKNLMQPDDAQQLEQWIEETNAQNDASATNWVREDKKPSRYFDVAKWRETQKKAIIKKKIVKENIIKEEGDPYEVTIFLQDADGSFYLSIEDNQGNEDVENFTSLKDVYDYILNYINKWDLS